MKAKLHNKHPVYLKLQDAVVLCNKLSEYTQLAYRYRDGSVSTLYNYANYLACLVGDIEYTLDGWRITKESILCNTCYITDIVKMVELFDEVELDGADAQNILRTLENYDRTMYVIAKDNIKLD